MKYKLSHCTEAQESAVPRKKITFIITGLQTGGAETMLLKLCSKIDRSRFFLSVISLRDHGTIGQRIEDMRVPVYSLYFHKNMIPIIAIYNFFKVVKDLQPDLIQGWMYHGNLAASLFARNAIVCWGVRQSFYGLGKERQLTRWIMRIGKLLSRFSNCIIYNSNTSARQHSEFGFLGKRSIVIPNGFDVDIMRPDKDSRLFFRNEFGLGDSAVLIGKIARFHPMKDHRGFLKAAELLIREFPSVYFLLAGSGVSTGNTWLREIIDDLGLGDRVLLLGEREDVPKITAALDIATSSSAWGEGFANSVGEAMSCGVPCVVTDVGDSAWIVGETGRVVPPSDPNALAAAWKSLIILGPQGRSALGALARERVRNNFSLDSVAVQYENLYTSLIDSVEV
jgi:glycosyltransferase involved in cell wall biosynthesis